MMSPASFTITREQAAELAEEFARNASADTADLEDMQRLSVEAILEAQNTGTYRVFPTMGPGWRELMFGGILPPVEPEPVCIPGMRAFPRTQGGVMRAVSYKY
eukprot:symbB.v1.2.013108.t1/scaffold921.1/size152096/4